MPCLDVLQFHTRSFVVLLRPHQQNQSIDRLIDFHFDFIFISIYFCRRNIFRFFLIKKYDHVCIACACIRYMLVVSSVSQPCIHTVIFKISSLAIKMLISGIAVLLCCVFDRDGVKFYQTCRLQYRIRSQALFCSFGSIYYLYSILLFLLRSCSWSSSIYYNILY